MANKDLILSYLKDDKEEQIMEGNTRTSEIYCKY